MKISNLFVSGCLLAAFAAVGRAEVSYPVNIDEWAGRTAYLDTDTGGVIDRERSWSTTDPDTYVCPVCGILPAGWPPNIVPLLETPPGPTPSYDSRLEVLTEVPVVCGPDPGTLDARCEGETDRIKGTWETSDRPTEERLLAARNEAAYRALLQMPPAQFRLHVLVQLGLNMMRLDSAELPPKWQAVNDGHWAFLLNKVLPIWDRRKELIDTVNGVDGAVIQGGDMDQGWPAVDTGDLPE